MRLTHAGILRWASGAALACALLLGCDGVTTGADFAGGDPPLDRPVFPTGLALHPSGDTLAVVSSNFDSRYLYGGLFLADLDIVDDMIAGTSPEVALNPYHSTVFMPSFGHRPLFSADGDRLLLTTRADNLLAELMIDDAADVRNVSCDSAVTSPDQGAPYCGDAASSSTALLPGNDPYEMVIYEERPDRLLGVVTFIRHPELVFFTLLKEGVGAQRIRVSTKQIGDDILGVRGATLLPRPGRTPLVVATADRLRLDSTRLAADVIYFDPAQTTQTNIRRFDLFSATGAEAARSLAVTPAGDALMVLTRAPDALVRLDIENSGSQVTFSIGGVATICADPSGLVGVELAGGAQRMLAACLNDDALIAIHPLTLDITDTAQDHGRGPFDIAVDTSRTPARAFVTFYYDNSVGVFTLEDDEGRFDLRAVGRLGSQSPPPEDGR